MKFGLKEYKELWNKLDADERAELIRLVQLDDKHQDIFMWTYVRGYSQKEISHITSWDKRQVERKKAEVHNRILNVLNRPKNNRIYSAILAQ